MSLILDALARAERERGATSGPGLEGPEESRPPEGASRRTRVLLGIGFLGALLLGGGLGAVLLRAPSSPVREAPGASADGDARALRTGGPEEAVPAPAPAVPDPRDESRARTVDPARAADPLPATRSDADAVAALYARSQAKPPAPEGTPAESPDVPAAAPEASAEPAEPVEQAIDIDGILRQVEIETAAAKLEAHPVPLLETLSQQFRDRVPTLMYLRHDYNPAGVSTVLINGEVLSAGQRSRGVELLEVLPDSAILRFEGTDFRLRALNSWVNL